MKKTNTTEKISFLHYAHKSCRGYEQHLKNSEQGKWINFFPEFLFLQGLCFLYYNMHKELASYVLLVGFLFSMGVVYPILSYTLLIMLLLTGPFVFYKLYQMHLDRKIDECKKYDSVNFVNLFMKYTRIPNVLFEIIAFIIYWIVYGILFLLSLYLFSNMFLGNY